MDLGGAREINGVFVQEYSDIGKAMQIRLGDDNVEIRFRQVPVEKMHDTSSDDPTWDNAYGSTFLYHWIAGNSPEWQWLKAKGLNEPAARLRQGGLKT